MPNELIGIVHIFGPKRSQLWESNFQPGLCLPVVVDDARLSYIFDITFRMVSQTQHVPR
ncbi:hypothetical protein Mapa_007129 [Marchantia paleacea]|nr:hypothetical protein Mapa_007129 [Marchantia paleacea]